MDQSLGIHLDAAADEPIYKQLFDQIAGRIRSGAFPDGFRLPPTRALADEVGTHRNTVVRAYEDLEAAGFVTSTVGRGTFVAPARPVMTAPAAAASPAAMPWSSIVSRAAEAEPIGRHDRLARAVLTGEMINLTRMQPPPELIPDELFRRCLDHVLRKHRAKALAYAPRDGLPRLREAIAADLARMGVPAAADRIIVTTGSQQALDLIARALIDPGDSFLVETCTYPGALHLLSAAGGRLVGVPPDDEGPELAALERLGTSGARPKGFYLMPNCNNPTGRTVSLARREQLVAWSHRTGIPIIEDDFDADLELDGRPPPAALRALDGEVVHLGTYSKKLIPALRVGYVVCPPGLMPRLAALRHTFDLGTSIVLQHALAEFLDRGYLAAHLNKTIPAYRARRDALVDGLARHLPKGVTFRRPERGLTLWIPLGDDVSPEALYDEAQRRGVLVSPGTLYRIDALSSEARGVRLTFCSENPARLAEGAKRLGQAYAALLTARRKQERTTNGRGALGAV
jgi:GntR family transcriptional regulator/MocR family aminotransferase